MGVELSTTSHNQLMLERLQRIAGKSGANAATRLPVDEWLEQNFWIPELKGPIKLMEYHKRCLREATRKDADGNYVYTTVVWGDIKKSAKSSIAGGVALQRAFATPYGQIVLIANDLKQADSRVFMYATRGLRLNPQFRHIKPVKHKVTLPNLASIEAVAIDPTGEAGGNPDFVVFSELWGAHQDAQQKMWTEMTIPPTKFGHAQRWVETYAGYDGESPTLERLYDVGVNQGRRLWDDIEAYANDAAHQFTLWNTHPRCPWQTFEYYAQQAVDLTPAEFDRIHRNRWVSSTQKFVPDEWWDACIVAQKRWDPHWPIVVGLDAAVSNDCFGIVAVARNPERPLTDTYAVYARKWKPTPGHKIIYVNPADPSDIAYPEGVVRWLARNYNVVQFAYDEFQLHEMCTRLKMEGIGWFKQFGQQSPRSIADKQLFDMIRDKRFSHPDHPDLSEHVKNANAKAEDKYLRLIKRNATKSIDCAVACSMANAECMRLNLG